MRVCPFLIVLFGCAHQPTTDEVYRSARLLLDQGHVNESSVQINSGIARESSSWRFRLLQAEALNLRGEAPEAFAELNGAPPEGAEERFRLALLRAQISMNSLEHERAKIYLAEAAQIARSLPPLRLAEVELTRGNLRFRQNRSQEAEQSFLAALRIATAENDTRLKAAANGSLGFLLLSTEHCDRAIDWFVRALAQFEQVGAEPKAGKTKGNLGWCYHRLGDNDKALALLEEARKSAHAAGNRRDEQAFLGNSASVMWDEGRIQDAASAYRQALEIAHQANEVEWIRRWSESLAGALIVLGELGEADRSNTEASAALAELNTKLKTPQRDLYIEVNTARLAVLRGKYDRAGALYRNLLSQPSDDPTPVLNARSDFAKLLVKRGRLSEADAQFRAALTQISSYQSGLVRDDFRLAYLSSLIEFCDYYVDFLVDRHEDRRALEVSESIRARVLNEQIAQANPASAAVHAEALQQAALSSRSILLSYWLAPKRSFLWVIRPGGVKLHILPPGSEIAGLVDNYRSQLEKLRDPMQSENPAGKRLSQMLLGPVREDLQKGAQFIVAPDRALHSLNLEALPNPSQPSEYVIEKARFVVAPSLALLASRPHASKIMGRSVLLIGDAETANPDFPRLPNAGRELALISQSFPAGQAVMRARGDAVPKSYVEAAPNQFSAIHFAVHANASRESPLDSALILSPSPSGYTLTAREVMNIPLKADLVTLSACHSAGARTFSGEGLVGLSWAFLGAGASAVVAGLWDVTDGSTADLMGDFYKQLASGMLPADALRAAKLELVHSKSPYRKPFYWAPFQLYAGRL
jgi:CHAT domain-containing protein/Tfp pilus assembly protein PilF